MGYICVLNRQGEPLMPTQRYGKIRRLVRENKARVVRRWPYTAQFDYDTPDIV